MFIIGFKVKESSNIGPRPEKPIEIYEFERYFCWGSVLIPSITFTAGICLLQIYASYPLSFSEFPIQVLDILIL